MTDGYVDHGRLGLGTIPEDDTDVRSESASRSGLRTSWFQDDGRSVAGSVAESNRATILTQGPSPAPISPHLNAKSAPAPCFVKMNWKITLMLGILVAAVVGGIFGIVSAVSAKQASAVESPMTTPSSPPAMRVSDDDFLPTDNPSSPSMEPSIQPSITLSPYLQELQSFLATNVSSEVLDPSTAYYRTFYWSAYEDPTPMLRGVDDDWRIIQRFLVAHLFFALDGQNWTFDNFLTGGTECDWDRVVCSNRTSSVKGIELHDSQLAGRLPSELSLLSDIQWLQLYNNSLTGTIPEAWWDFQSLKILNLSSNAITGQLSSQLWKLPSLWSLEVHDNLLTGGIPEVSDDASPLQLFNASYNRLNGTMPASLWNLQNLTALSLKFNKLTGGLPEVPEGRSIVLHTLGLDHNAMQGSLPPCLGMGELGSFVTLFLS